MLKNKDPIKGWRKKNKSPSLSEVFSTVYVPKKKGIWRKFFAFTGPGLLIAVGYMDPGNWATDIAGGSKFGYMLLSVIFISNIFAIILQHLSLKLGIVCERDLAQACRDHYPPFISFILWILCEIAIASCDLAEIIGSVLALKLLFGIPITWGVLITTIDVLLILFFQYKGFRYIESVVAVLIFTILICFSFEIISSKPEILPILKGIIPNPEIIKNSHSFYISIGILGATVMPHNLYLHSSIIQTRNYQRTIEGKKMAIKYATIDSTLSLSLAFFINAAILIISAATFHKYGHTEVADILDAHKLLSPILGSSLSGVFFALALLASGQNSTLTGTLSGQIVMEGFLHIRLKPWVRRLITRLIAIVPAMIASIIYGEKGTAELLIISQIILSIQLSFAIIPLVNFTGDYNKMGLFVNGPFLKILSWFITIIIVLLNLVLLYNTFQ
ncbi:MULTISPECIES: Nramp family divalent metal transporter [Blattabacterium]|uniref:Divalent metal cation transporter MntH n=1 Tax=Blattabacterium punctulatus TaxID=164514 RepID=A0ABN5M215_9FLAO|nr:MULTISPECIES: Nramp family divalent metal transporter [Blattabacterium]AEU09365.1 Mn2 /Fe2 transporter, NRAMP family [Blattabacterium sp. (Cryptocercus punctulatus) str. Cpu]AWU39861.1 divalent metal cation transporter [Blattabacterium punctulatus]AWU40405.1 divalent metal cation transporter [Blattabacterium punctulatus]AWU44860.1 divalent metal cation transporter [Blattabacterium punctulatus]